jgi:hypothetical protein
MKQELEVPEVNAVTDRRVMGVDWIDSKSATPVSVDVIKAPNDFKCGRNRNTGSARRVRFSQVLMKAVGVAFNLTLFCWSCAQGVGHGLGLIRRGSPQVGDRMRRIKRNAGLILLFVLAIGFAGCVGYVGPGPGVDVYGPGFYGPDVTVFGGGYYHGHYAHAYSARGAVSRGGFHGGHR